MDQDAVCYEWLAALALTYRAGADGRTVEPDRVLGGDVVADGAAPASLPPTLLVSAGAVAFRAHGPLLKVWRSCSCRAVTTA